MAQSQPWFPALLECLSLDTWPIPGLSSWWSTRSKEFLKVSVLFYPRNDVYVADNTQEIESDSYFTFHQLVPATASASTVVDAGSIVHTVCEGCELLFTTQALDHLVRVDRFIATHAIYWPLVLLNVIIGPYLINGACFFSCMIYFINTRGAVAIGARLMHGTSVAVHDWNTCTTTPNWTKYAHYLPTLARVHTHSRKGFQSTTH